MLPVPVSTSVIVIASAMRSPLVSRRDDCEDFWFAPRRADAAANDLIRDRLRNANPVTTGRKFAHLVPILCCAAQVAVFSIDISHWRPIEDWWYVDFLATLIAVGGSVYAAAKTSRWWFVMTGIEVLLAILLVLALGG